MDANVIQKRAEAGSRFNIRYDNGVPPDGATPAAIMASLSKYVDFGRGGGSAPPIHFENSAPNAPDGPAPAPRKGLMVVQTEQILGAVSEAGFNSSLYFSIVTFTTLGYGDVLPKPPFRLLAASEAVLGLVSLASSFLR